MAGELVMDRERLEREVAAKRAVITGAMAVSVFI
jgi:hypothetical protein